MQETGEIAAFMEVVLLKTDRLIIFQKKNRKEWRMKKAELDQLLADYKVDTRLLETSKL